MKTLMMVLGVAAVLSTCGCSTHSHLLEPGVDKYAGLKGTNDPYRAGCCDEPDCACGQDHMDKPCPPCQRVQP
jgi:hypothetical protein